MKRSSAFSLFFFASGFAGLVYQVVWTRQAGLILGNTTTAIGTVVAVFMGGLALGSALGGRWASRNAGRPSSLLRAYAVLEGAIGLFGLAVPLLFLAVEPIYRAAYGWFDTAPALFNALRVLLCALVFLGPATLMGATLPILVQYFARETTGTAHAAGRLYAINTAGAAAGTAVAGLLLLPLCGLRIATWSAAAVNLSIAAAAWQMTRDAASEAAKPADAPAGAAPFRFIYVLYALSGFVALLYEVAWTRALTLAIGSTAYAFTLILVAFIGGLALGAALVARRIDRVEQPERIFAIVQLLIAIVSVGMFVFLRTLPQTLVGIYDALKGSFVGLKFAEFAVISLVVAVPTILMGALLPVACRILAADAPASGRAVGRLYAWNTLGCILGSAGASFALIPLLGLDLTLRVGAALSAAVAIVAVLAWARKSIAVAGGAVATAIVAFVLPGWDVMSMSLGAYIYGPDIGQQADERFEGDLAKFIEKQPRPIATYWDSYALVTVHKLDTGHLALRINGKTDASTGTLDQATQILASAIPMAIHPDPREVLVIGLGSGVTLANVVAYPDVQAECVELCPAVKKAADEFREATDDVLRNPRAPVIINDARTHVQYTRKRYDVIVSEPSNLWLSGMATLFTREYFATARARLKPGGIMAQWLHAYRLSVSDFRAIVRTYLDVFPQSMLWETHPEGDYLLVGWTGEPKIDLDLVARRLASLPPRPERTHAGLTDPVAFMGNFVGGPTALARIAEGARPVTDDHCWIEYTAPLALYRDERPELVRLFTPGRTSPVEALAGGTPAMRDAIDRRVRGRRSLAPVAVTSNPQHLVQMPALMDAALADAANDPVVKQVVDDRVNTLFQFARVMTHVGRITDAARALSAVPPRHAQFAEAQVAIAKVLEKLDRLPDAREAYRRAWQARPGHAHAGTALAEFLTAEGNPKAALDLLVAVLRDTPDHTDARVARARALWKDGQAADARAELDRVLAAHPDHAGARELRTEILK